MNDRATIAVAQYVSEKGIKISAMSRATKISEGILRRSLSTKERDLRAEEFLKICRFLGKSAFDFYDQAG